MQAVTDDFTELVQYKIEHDKDFKKLIEELEQKDNDPFSLAETIIKKMLKNPNDMESR